MDPISIFTRLPVELIVSCLTFCIPAWSLKMNMRCSKHTTRQAFEARASILVGSHAVLNLMAVSKDFQGMVKEILLKQYDKKIELGHGAPRIFRNVVEKYNLFWLTTRVEILTLHHQNLVHHSGEFKYSCNLPALKRIDILYGRPSRVDIIHKAPTTKDITVGGAMDQELFTFGRDCSRLLKGRQTALARLRRDQSIQINGIWTCKEVHGETSPNVEPIEMCEDRMTFTATWMTRSPVIQEKAVGSEGSELLWVHASTGWETRMNNFWDLVRGGRFTELSWTPALSDSDDDESDFDTEGAEELDLNESND